MTRTRKLALTLAISALAIIAIAGSSLGSGAGKADAAGLHPAGIHAGSGVGKAPVGLALAPRPSTPKITSFGVCPGWQAACWISTYFNGSICRDYYAWNGVILVYGECRPSGFRVIPGGGGGR